MNTPDPFTPATEWEINGETYPCKEHLITEHVRAWLPKGMCIYYATPQKRWRLTWRHGHGRGLGFATNMPELSKKEIKRALVRWHRNITHTNREQGFSRYPELNTFTKGVSVCCSAVKGAQDVIVQIFVSLIIEENGKPKLKQQSRTVCKLSSYKENPDEVKQVFVDWLCKVISYRWKFEEETLYGTINLPTKLPGLNLHTACPASIEHVSSLDIDGMLDFIFNTHCMAKLNSH